MQLGYLPDRSGDVVAVNRPYCLPMGKLSTCTSHGSPHVYDTHIPILVPGGDFARRDPVRSGSGLSSSAR
jgi:hypothetical protein